MDLPVTQEDLQPQRKGVQPRPFPPAHAPFPWWPRPFPPAHAPFPWWPCPFLPAHAPFPWWPCASSLMATPLPSSSRPFPGGHAPSLLTSQSRMLGQHPPLESPAPPLSLRQEQKRLQLLDGISTAKVSWVCSRGRCPQMLQENRSEMQRHQKTPARPAHNTPALFRGLQPF